MLPPRLESRLRRLHFWSLGCRPHMYCMCATRGSRPRCLSHRESLLPRLCMHRVHNYPTCQALDRNERDTSCSGCGVPVAGVRGGVREVPDVLQWQGAASHRQPGRIRRRPVRLSSAVLWAGNNIIRIEGMGSSPIFLVPAGAEASHGTIVPVPAQGDPRIWDAFLPRHPPTWVF